jgi:hypothetical protein
MPGNLPPAAAREPATDKNFSTTPDTSRSFHSVSLKVLSSVAFCGSAVEGLKSGTASRTFSTPRLVPVLTQSCAKSGKETKQQVTTSRNASLHTLSPKFGCVGLQGAGYNNFVFR